MNNIYIYTSVLLICGLIEAPSECEYKEHGPEGNPCVWGAPPSPQ